MEVAAEVVVEVAAVNGRWGERAEWLRRNGGEKAGNYRRGQMF